MNGWTTRTAQELDQTIRTWGEMFAHYQIPVSAYPELYQRGFDVRQLKMREGKDVPQMDATLMVSQWTGDWGLRAQLRQREVEAGRTLASNAESICQRCLGSGWEVVEGKGARRCDHL